ncbi:lamin tail domain-containing protein [Deinococcus misasensis]|uniref:lamin tail domain-containing protein n=1 Tax=Deinococcus misasensis TaxID=392413 RepID=UPI0005503D26|nr:lamin tail domain-containing protein [Deinococcus misasensis]
MKFKSHATLLLLSLTLSACGVTSQSPVTPPTPTVHGAIELTFEMGPDKLSVAFIEPMGVRGDTDVKFVRPAAYTDYDDTSGYRYMNATFTVKNLSAQPFENLTLYAFNKASQNIGGTAIKNIKNAAAVSITDTSVARSILPTHGTNFDALSGNSVIVPTQADLQVFTSSEANTIQAAALSSNIISAGDTVLQYGYSARNLNSTGNKRRLEAAGCSTTNCDTGRITIAVRVPNNNSATTPYRFTLTFVLADETTTRVTQSTLEQNNDALVYSRAADVGATDVRVMGESSYDGDATRVCLPRFAVASGADGDATLGTDCTNNVTDAAQKSEKLNVVITEFQTLGSEFIELKNTTGASINIQGYWFRNNAGTLARLRAPSDPTGLNGTPVVVPAGGSVYGVANPSNAADIPAGASFVYGAPGSTFSLADTGDFVSLYRSENGAVVLEDALDFRQFLTDASVSPSMSTFVGASGKSTQLDPGAVGLNGNNGSKWCVTFYPTTGTRTQVADTRGATNSSCSMAVINEVLIDATGTDDSKTFLELAGPGGALVGGMVISDVEGLLASAGTLNADGDVTPGETDGQYVIPANTRIPADGLLVIADGTSIGGTTTVSNADLIARDVDFENGGGDSIILASSTGNLLDAVGHDVNGNNLATNTAAVNGLSMYEGNTAIYPLASLSLARDANSTDTNNNRNDFHNDPSPTPGLPNDTVTLSINTLSPNSAPANGTTTSVSITGTEFHTGMTVKFGATNVTCAVANPSTMTCTAPAGGGIARTVDVSITSPFNGVNTTVTKTAAFTYL